ncbi:MAG: hypothetical protein MMC33_000186 [Icmadophila ericetorum]|nr:hypothetical protein [Icmadophila ericetorum]
MASALSPNIGAQLAFRFIAGFFGSTPLVCAGGSINDLWNPLERLYAFPIFANAAFLGPIFDEQLFFWRKVGKLHILRELTGDDRYKAEVEIREQTIFHRLSRALYRPFILTFREPIIILMALYLVVIYIILFTSLTGCTFIFSNTYGFSQSINGLTFLGIGVGFFCASVMVLFIYRSAGKRLARIKVDGGDRLPPEFRLWIGVIGASFIPISMFWMGWTSYPEISYWSPIIANILFGFGILGVFISSYFYIIECYANYAANALASVTLLRYVAAGGMVEASIPMYENLGVHWTLTILGAISALLVPVPFIFYACGVKIRAKSKYAVV